jgi:hypothetical protein
VLLVWFWLVGEIGMAGYFFLQECSLVFPFIFIISAAAFYEESIFNLLFNSPSFFHPHLKINPHLPNISLFLSVQFRTQSIHLSLYNLASSLDHNQKREPTQSAEGRLNFYCNLDF